MILRGIVTLFLSGCLFLAAFADKADTTNAQTPTELEIEAEFFGVDLICIPICWQLFLPGQTPIGEVYEWFRVAFDETQSFDFKRDVTAINNNIAAGSSILSISAYSDDTQPAPNLRTFYVGIGFHSRAGNMSASGLTLKEAQLWLPAGMISRYGNPSFIGYGEFYGSYLLVMDFANHNTVVVYPGYITDPDGARLICPIQDVNSINVWVYPDSEINGVALLRDLEANYEFHSSVTSNSMDDIYTEVRNTTTITNLVNSFNQTGCISAQNRLHPD